MNINDLPKGSYTPVQSPTTGNTLNIKDLPAGSYTPVKNNPQEQSSGIFGNSIPGKIGNFLTR